MATIQEEAERLNRFIGNLLDMTRLESGAIELKPELVDRQRDRRHGARSARRKLLAEHRVEIDIAPDLPMLRLDYLLFEQVLFNLLDNAAKYAPPGSAGADFGAPRRRRASSLVSSDEGPGIPPGDLERIFDKFYRVQAADRQRAGTGLGLAICRGFVEAMGGTIAAGNRSDRSGARVHHPPCPSQPEQSATAARAHDQAQPPILDRRRRAADPAFPAHQPGGAGLSTSSRPRRRRGAGRRSRARQARPGGARSRPARHGRPRGHPRRPQGSTTCRSSCCRSATTSAARSRRSISAPTITSPSPSAWRS